MTPLSTPLTRGVTAAAVAAALIAAATVPAVPARASSPPPLKPGGPSTTAPPSERSEVSADGLRLSVAVSSDGLGRFSDDDRPGGDSGPRNGVVRTADAVVYAVTVGTSEGSATGGVRLTAAEGTSWAGVPDECSAGSAVDGDVLSCELGTLTGGARTVSAVASVSTALPHAAVLEAGVEAHAVGLEPVEVTAPAVTVSAAPRFDVSMSRTVPAFSPSLGADGTTPGFSIVYPLQVHWESLVEGGGLLGYEQLADGITLVDDVSRMYGSSPSPAVLHSVDGAPACGVNTGQIAAAPGGVGGGERAVVDSGTVTCEQAAPGEPVSITVRGTDTSLASVPTRSVSGGQIAGGVVPYVVSAYVSLWVPAPPLGQSFTARNTYRDVAATSISGRANYDGEPEPDHDNSVDRNVSQNAGVGGVTRYYGWDAERSASFPLSGKNDLPYVTPAQSILSSTSLNNRGVGPWGDTVVCSVFDNTVQTLRENAPGSWAASNSVGTTGRPEFAAFAGGDQEAARSATCDDDDLEWHADPLDVEGGPAAVGAVRWSYDHPATTTIGFNVHLTVAPRLENDTRVRTFSSMRTSTDGEWTHDRADAESANGPWSDFLTTTSNTARITSAVVDPGHDAGDTPDQSAFVTAGGTVRYALYPSVTNASDDRVAEVVTVRDVLPAGAEFVPGSSSPEPVVDEVEIDGEARQRLTWRFDPVEVNATIAPLVFDARFTSTRAGVEALNRATIESSRDVSAPSFRTSDRALQVLAGSGFDTEETVDHPVHVIGDEVVFTLSYRNVGSEALPSSSLISTLPHPGDGSTTAATQPRLVAPVAADGDTETVSYTGAPSADVHTDPAHGSNQPGGATTWCLEAELGRAGCPTGLDDVTAVRVHRDGPVERGGSVEHELVLTGADDSADSDVWASTFALRVAGIDWATTSNRASTRVAAGTLGHRVWTDVDADGVRGDDEPGRPGHPVRVTGTDDRGDLVSRAVATDALGRWSTTGLRPGDYRVDVGEVPGGWTTVRAGDDPERDSDVDADGRAAVTVSRVLDPSGALAGVSRHDHVDAGALADPAEPPVVEPPVVDPPVVEPPVVDPPVVDPPTDEGSTSTSPGADPEEHLTAEAQEPRPAVLAFTGGPLVLGLTALAALLALAAGGVVLLARRRSAERDDSTPSSV
ncbi:SdrD B-like domain-containing protein [Frigoribacterium sp. Leaf164]|uniref:SdrD B-like domain-containing protein n=1 Tax=Frigoribacterium sp. Leaf164 TaxID=1736282 RepID=UPI0012E2F6E1|nr:SdrD B-like domain-containing protein [Frigoribacterium sp. Leaf164]